MASRAAPSRRRRSYSSWDDDRVNRDQHHRDGNGKHQRGDFRLACARLRLLLQHVQLLALAGYHGRKQLAQLVHRLLADIALHQSNRRRAFAAHVQVDRARQLGELLGLQPPYLREVGMEPRLARPIAGQQGQVVIDDPQRLRIRFQVGRLVGQEVAALSGLRIFQRDQGQVSRTQLLGDADDIALGFHIMLRGTVRMPARQAKQDRDCHEQAGRRQFQFPVYQVTHVPPGSRSANKAGSTDVSPRGQRHASRNFCDRCAMYRQRCYNRVHSNADLARLAFLLSATVFACLPICRSELSRRAS